MHGRSLPVVIVLMAALGAAGCHKKSRTQPAPSQVARGTYLAALMGCVGCHTPLGPGGPDMTRAWSGGLEVTEKFGTWRSPNITQDKATGIGGWSDAQILAAIRQGKRPDGTHLYPIMPYLYYNALSNQDGAALVAFLRTIRPVANKVSRATDIKLPTPPAPPPTGKAPDPSDAPAYGGYLASLMHCAMCHTPPGPDGTPDRSKLFAGGYPFVMPPMFGTGTVYSSNITPDKKTGIGNYTDDDIVRALREMKKKDGSMIKPPMAMYQQGWYQIHDQDARAIAAFLRSLPPIANQVPASTFKPNPPPGGAAPAAAPTHHAGPGAAPPHQGKAAPSHARPAPARRTR